MGPGSRAIPPPGAARITRSRSSLSLAASAAVVLALVAVTIGLRDNGSPAGPGASVPSPAASDHGGSPEPATPTPSPPAHSPTTEVSPTLTTASAPVPTGEWGPLAILPAQDGGDTSAIGGRLSISGPCVYLDHQTGLPRFLLIWHADQVRWDAQTVAIEFENDAWRPAPRTGVLRDGDEVVLGGGAGEELPDGPWVAPPSPSCVFDEWFGVSAVEFPAGGS